MRIIDEGTIIQAQRQGTGQGQKMKIKTEYTLSVLQATVGEYMKKNITSGGTMKRMMAIALFVTAGYFLAPQMAQADPVHISVGIGLPIGPRFIDREHERDRERREWMEHHRWGREREVVVRHEEFHRDADRHMDRDHDNRGNDNGRQGWGHR